MMSEKIAKILLESKSVQLNPENPFTYASGIKSPVYTDCRRLISLPQERMAVVEEYVKNLGEAENLLVCGTASAGIPWAAWIAGETSQPLIYVRKEKKGHGLGQAIEGSYAMGCRAAVIEDLVSTGQSSIKAVKTLEDGGVSVEKVLSIFTYGLDEAWENFKAQGITLESLTNLDELLDVAVAKDYLTPQQADEVRRWKTDPKGWVK